MNAIEIIMHRSLFHDRPSVKAAGKEVTSASLAKLAVSQLARHFDEGLQVEVFEFAPSTAEAYSLKARIEAPKIAGLLRDDLPSAVENFEERFRAAIQPFSFTKIDIAAIILDGVRHGWEDLLDVRMDQWVSSGKHVLSLSPDEVLIATVKQVGDFAILEVTQAFDGVSYFVVAKIDDNGMAQPVQGGLEWDEAEVELGQRVGSTSTMSIRF